MWTTYRTRSADRTRRHETHAHVGAVRAQADLGNAVVLEVAQQTRDAEPDDPKQAAAERLHAAASELGADAFGLDTLFAAPITDLAA